MTGNKRLGELDINMQTWKSYIINGKLIMKSNM